MMRTRWPVSGMVVAVLVGGCTTGAPPDSEATATTPTATSTMEVPTPTPTPTPEPAATPVVGTGIVTVDGTELPVSGDCDISKEFGERPVADLEDADVDVLLAVDNLDGEGHQGDFPVEVRLLGTGEVVGRTITSVGGVGASGADAPVFEGDVEVASLVDREEGEFADTATLHLEAAQQRRQGDGGGATRDLVVDVTCLIARPPT